jgi:hypothetical protein
MFAGRRASSIQERKDNIELQKLEVADVLEGILEVRSTMATVE